MLAEVKIPYILRVIHGYAVLRRRAIESRFMHDRIPRRSSGKINRSLYLWQFAHAFYAIHIHERNGKTTMIARDDVRQRERGEWIKYCFWTIEMDRLFATTEINYRILKIVEVAVIEGIRVHFHQASLILENINGFDICVDNKICMKCSDTFWI